MRSKQKQENQALVSGVPVDPFYTEQNVHDMYTF